MTNFISILPIYNAEKDLNQCLKSIQSQKYRELSIRSIIINKNADEFIYKIIMVGMIILDRVLSFERFKSKILKKR